MSSNHRVFTGGSGGEMISINSQVHKKGKKRTKPDTQDLKSKSVPRTQGGMKKRKGVVHS